MPINMLKTFTFGHYIPNLIWSYILKFIINIVIFGKKFDLHN